MRVEPPIPDDVFAAVRAPFDALEAYVLEAPLVQPLSLLLDLVGETLRERLFIVQGGAEAEEACLRTDFTVAAVAAHAQSGRETGRYVYSGRAFRAAPAGSSRAEEFPQFGLECFERGNPVALDAEMAGLAWRAAAAGGRFDLTLMLGDVALFSSFVDSLQLSAALAVRLKRAFSSPRKLRAELDRARARGGAAHRPHHLAQLLETLPQADAVPVLEDIWRLANIEPVGGRGPSEIVHRLIERAQLAREPGLTEDQASRLSAFLAITGSPLACLEEAIRLSGVTQGPLWAAGEAWRARLEAIAEQGVPAEAMRFSAAFGRAFGYYDGMVFEVRSAALGDDQPVGAGGRYDGLAERLGARLGAGAVGCMVRPGRAWIGAQP